MRRVASDTDAGCECAAAKCSAMATDSSRRGPGTVRTIRRKEGRVELTQVSLEPIHSTFHEIPLVIRTAEHVSFARVDHELGRRALSFQRMPEFVRLRSGTLAVTFAD